MKDTPLDRERVIRYDMKDGDSRPRSTRRASRTRCAIVHTEKSVTDSLSDDVEHEDEDSDAEGGRGAFDAGLGHRIDWASSKKYDSRLNCMLRWSRGCIGRARASAGARPSSYGLRRAVATAEWAAMCMKSPWRGRG